MPLRIGFLRSKMRRASLCSINAVDYRMFLKSYARHFHSGKHFSQKTLKLLTKDAECRVLSNGHSLSSKADVRTRGVRQLWRLGLPAMFSLSATCFSVLLV